MYALSLSVVRSFVPTFVAALLVWATLFSFTFAQIDPVELPADEPEFTAAEESIDVVGGTSEVETTTAESLDDEAVAEPAVVGSEESAPTTARIAVSADVDEVADESAAEATTPAVDAVEPTTTVAPAPARLMRVTSSLNVRLSPSVSADRVGVAYPGFIATVTGTPVEADGFTWFSVSFENGLTGWSVANWLE